jgi:hypothetical protein
MNVIIGNSIVAGGMPIAAAAEFVAALYGTSLRRVVRVSSPLWLR